jgi:ribosome-binding ATPase YchF (GTP1/OBG family)
MFATTLINVIEVDHFFVLFFSVLDRIIVQGYKALQLQYFFTAGPDEVKAWTIQVIQGSLFAGHKTAIESTIF